MISSKGFGTVCRPLTVKGAVLARTMASISPSKMNINAKYKMPSGYEIPILGFGV